MKIDNAIRAFSEKYDRDAIESIDSISKNYSLNISGSTIKAFNIKESFDTFSEYLKGYAQYKTENKDNDKASPQDIIRESVNKFISTSIFKESDIKYNELPSFVQSYVSGVTSLTETVDSVKSSMTEAGIDHEAVGDVNDFTDQFMDQMNESFYSCMDKILTASGYSTKQRLFSNKKSAEPKPVFL